MPVQRMHPSQQLERRSSNEPLAPRQRVWLSRGVVALCHWRLEHILRHGDPSDLPLADFLKEQIAAEEESADSLKRLDWSLHDGDDLEFVAKEYDQLLSRVLPSAYSRTGEGHMDRDAALHFVETLYAERNSFFAKILEGPSSEPAVDRLRAESDRSAERLRLVQTILLPPPQSSEPVSKPPTSEGRRAGASERRSWVVSVSARVNQLRQIRRASPSDAPGTTRPLVAELLRDLEGAAADAHASDEPLARRFLREFGDLRKEGARNLDEILGVARVALAWLMGGHTRRSRLKTTAAQKVNA
jgi:hypothetical protein